MISEALAGKRIAMTGSTGFLGTALTERLLRTVDDCEIVLLVRPGRRGATKRVERDILRNDCFDRLREQVGPDAFAAMIEQRIHPIAADVTADDLALDDEGREMLAGCDIVIHSAAAVAFDNPYDLAVETNLLGPVRLAATLNELGVTPHLIAVSTAYVAGNRKGAAPEQLLADSAFAIDVDWRTEADSARRSRITLEDESRTPDRLGEFQKMASDEVGAAGNTALAAKSEQHRQRWIKDQLVDAGRARAASLGFPDAYAFTKALAEQALVETRGDIPLSIVRPSIIESSYAEPFPGWIRGFRMAEPIIIAFGRGLLKDFPGLPEGALDVIPVDHVVSAICAVAAKGPEDQPEVFQVASGSTNPLRFQGLHDFAHAWFSENPIYDERDQPISPTRWSYPSIHEAKGQLDRARRGLRVAERALQVLPVRGRGAVLAGEIEEQREQLERAMGYVELYGMYVECEATYGTSELLRLHGSLPEADRAAFNFDPRTIDWDHYLTDIHFPSVMIQGRVKVAPSGKGGESRSTRLRRQVLSPDRHIAAFDLENTLIASNVVASWGWLATRRLNDEDRIRLVAKTLLQAPGLLALDRRDRSDFLRQFYRRYKGAPIEQLETDTYEMFSDVILKQSFPAGIRRVREHRALGHRTVLITGALDFVVAPFRPLFDEVVCAHLATDGDVYTGQLLEVPPTGESRAQGLADYAEAEGLSLSEACAYADSTSDLPMLEAVGFPVAVNPETKLATLARRRGWLVEIFDKAPGGPRKLLPIGRRRTA
ncbi:MAG: HAD-IB family hydrolase [Acidimicrobiales bacterium]